MIKCSSKNEDKQQIQIIEGSNYNQIKWNSDIRNYNKFKILKAKWNLYNLAFMATMWLVYNYVCSIVFTDLEIYYYYYYTQFACKGSSAPMLLRLLYQYSER